MLDIHGRGLTLIEVEKAQALGEYGAVRLDRLSLAPLQAIASVVAGEKGSLKLTIRVEHDRRHLLEVGRGVELFPQPWAASRSAREVHHIHRPIRVKARRALSLSGEPQEHARPELHGAAANQEIVVCQPDLTSIAGDIS